MSIVLNAKEWDWLMAKMKTNEEFARTPEGQEQIRLRRERDAELLKHIVPLDELKRDRKLIK